MGMFKKLFCGANMKIDYEFWFQYHLLNPTFKAFTTSTPVSSGKYREYTIHNKGSLWKIRLYLEGHFKVFYGTQEKAYCTTLKDCINIITTKQLQE